MSEELAPILVDGRWRAADACSTFASTNPSTGETLPGVYPVSRWADLDAALDAASTAFELMQDLPVESFASFLEGYANMLESSIAELAKLAEEETALPATTRLRKVELPRTCNQLRLAAKAARVGEWALPTIDTGADLRSMHVPVGPVAVFGPNNFPFAYHGIAGGDFAAAVAVGNPVIAKAHPLHPGTSRRLAELCKDALDASDLPPAAVQFVYHFENDDGLRLVADARIGASGFTGSRKGGMALKAAADQAGKPIYLEMSSVNPVVLLPGALAAKTEALIDDYVQSCLLGVGQFCTNPGLTFMTRGEAADRWIDGVKARFEDAPPGVLFAKSSVESLAAGVADLQASGATLVTGGDIVEGVACRFANTLLRVDGPAFLRDAAGLQSEVFGNCGLVVVCENVDQLLACLRLLDGNLTGSIYSERGDDYQAVEKVLRHRVGRLINDHMPTGVAVSPAQMHGGPYPSSGHGGFTAVGPPACLRRFSQLRCYDNVDNDRLPPLLRDENLFGGFRYVDGVWTDRSL